MNKFLIGIILISMIVVGAFFVLSIHIEIPKAEYDKVSISKLLRNPKDYERKWLNVSGYLEYKEKVDWTEIMPHIYYTFDDEGNSEMHIGIQLIEHELFIFWLHEKPIKDSSYVIIIKETEGLYFPIFPLPFWYSHSWGIDHPEPNVIYQNEGFALGIWKYKNIREHGKLWVLDTHEL